MSEQLSFERQEIVNRASKIILDWFVDPESGTTVSISQFAFLCSNYSDYLAATEELRPQARRDTIKELWLAGFWESPLAEFVRQYMPGPEPRANDYLVFARDLGSQFEFDHITTHLSQMMDDAFRACGVEPSGMDDALRELILSISPATVHHLESILEPFKIPHPAWDDFKERFAASHT